MNMKISPVPFCYDPVIRNAYLKVMPSYRRGTRSLVKACELLYPLELESWLDNNVVTDSLQKVLLWTPQDIEKALCYSTFDSRVAAEVDSYDLNLLHLVDHSWDNRRILFDCCNKTGQIEAFKAFVVICTLLKYGCLLDDLTFNTLDEQAEQIAKDEKLKAFAINFTSVVGSTIKEIINFFKDAPTTKTIALPTQRKLLFVPKDVKVTRQLLILLASVANLGFTVVFESLLYKPEVIFQVYNLKNISERRVVDFYEGDIPPEVVVDIDYQLRLSGPILEISQQAEAVTVTETEEGLVWRETERAGYVSQAEMKTSAKATTAMTIAGFSAVAIAALYVLMRCVGCEKLGELLMKTPEGSAMYDLGVWFASRGSLKHKNNHAAQIVVIRDGSFDESQYADSDYLHALLLRTPSLTSVAYENGDKVTQELTLGDFDMVNGLSLKFKELPDETWYVDRIRVKSSILSFECQNIFGDELVVQTAKVVEVS